MAQSTPQRIAANETAFRDANERIERAADAMAGLDAVPLICECGRADCTELLSLAREEYERVRSRSNTFWVVLGHEITEVDGETIGRVVERNERFSVMEKIGEAREVAEERDPRGG